MKKLLDPPNNGMTDGSITIITYGYLMYGQRKTKRKTTAENTKTG